MKISRFFTPQQPVVTVQKPQSKITVNNFKSDNIPTYTPNEIPGLSIKKTEEEASKNKEEEEKQANLAKECQPFTEEDFKKVWKQYEEKIPEKKILVSSMQSCLMTIGQDYSVDIAVENEVQKKQFTEEKADLLTYLSQTLRNGKIRLFFRITESGENKSVLTPVQRFKEMLDRNPNLAALKEKLGLEIS